MKILSINLPHVSFYDIPNYVPYLYQKIYHHIVPKNRENRDFYLGIMLTTKVMTDIFKWCMKAQEKNGSDREELNGFEKIIYEFVNQNYNDIHQNIVATGVKFDSKKFVAKEYVKILRQIISELFSLDLAISQNENNLLVKMFKYIEKNLSNIKESIKKQIQQIHTEKNEILLQLINSKEQFLQTFDKWFKGFKEVSADIPMIELSNMEFEDYLTSYIIRQMNMMDNTVKWKLEEDISECIRLQMISMYYNKDNRMDWENLKQKVKYLFLARKLIIPNEQDVWHDLRREEKIIEQWINNNFNVLTQIENYECYKDVFDLFCKEVGINNRLKSYHRQDRIREYYLKYQHGLKSYRDDIRNGMLRENVSDLHESYLVFEKLVFETNIELIQELQISESLKEVGDVNRKKNCEKQKKRTEISAGTDTRGNNILKNYEKNHITYLGDAGISIIEKKRWEYSANSLPDLIDKLKIVTGLLNTSCKNEFHEERSLWYRGQMNAGYELLPHIMRPVEKNKNRGKYHYLAEYQRYLYEEFKYRADGSPEMFEAAKYCTSDYIALMQHYSVCTNFLDWSEDAFTAAFFAFEDIIAGETGSLNTDSAIYVFSPHLYNLARCNMMKEAKTEYAVVNQVLEDSKKTIVQWNGEVPNISTPYNEKLYEMFLLGNVKYEQNTSHRISQNITLNGQAEMAYLPIAVYTSKLNPRIRTQSGIFLVYNLYANSSGGDYSYLSLEKIQDYYLNKSGVKNKNPFLYKISINKYAARDIALQFKTLGTSKGKIYPELKNFGEEIF